jgi:NADPH:quinone reductase
MGRTKVMTMRVRAARLVGHGKPVEIAEVELAEPQAGEVLVEMAYGGVNPVDMYATQGRVAQDAPVPRTLGGEGAGTVAGRHVMVRGHGLGGGRDGVWAQAAVVPQAALVDVPDGVPLTEAAAMGVAGLTAWRTVTELAQAGPDDTVLVLGASGGVGSVITSLAHGLGATVIGQTGNQSSIEFVAGLGADHVVVSDGSDLASQVADFPPTVVLDCLGGSFTGQAIEALQPHGRLVLYGVSAGGEGELPLRTLYRKGLTVYGYGGLIEPDDVMTAATRAALNGLARGEFAIPLDSVLPLDQANEAFERITRRGVRGKIVLDVNALS